MTIYNILTPLIAIIALGIAFFQLETNREKIRLDLYNRRFEIYTKTLDLYFELHNFKSIKEPSKEDIVTFKKVMRSFSKYQSESQFLFKEDSGVFSILGGIFSNIWIIITYIEHNEEWRRLDDAAINQKKFEEYNVASMSFESDIGRLNIAIEPYLFFGNMFQKYPWDRCLHPKLGKNKSA